LVLISILTYTYDRKKYLLKAVDSALHQSLNRSEYEILVVKGFRDEIIDEALNRNNVRVLFLQEKSLGKKIATGIRECRGEFVCFLDDDDEFEPDKISVISSILSEMKDVDFIHNSIVKINESGAITNPNPKDNISTNLSLTPSKMAIPSISKVIRFRGDWYLSGMCIRKSILENTLVDLENTNQSLDKFVFFAALNHGRRIMMIRDRLTRYRLHTSTTTYIGTEEEFIAKRRAFFENTVSVFRNIVKISENLPGVELAGCQLMQNRINLYFISDQMDSKISFREFVEFFGCLRVIRSRYQIIWICAFLIRKLSYRLSAFAYYTFFKMSFKGTL